MLQPAQTTGDTRWFVQDRFGLFIHWGLYALPARHEWVKSREEISDEAYERYFRHFDPDLYEPALWAQAAARAGMKYFVVTTKHHDGFCLWDSDLTEYKATRTPHGRDVLTPLVAAFRAENMRVGFYHSLLDWRHPQYPLDANHPQRNHPEARAMNQDRDVRLYADYLHGQTRELLTRFGPIDILWYDFSFKKPVQPEFAHFEGKGKDDWRSEELLKMIRELQPGIILNDRLQIDQDVKTPEQYQPREWVKVNGQPVVWEACQTFSGSWGYHRDESTWKSPAQLVKMLINSVACGGNLLMNVGPTGRGELDQRTLDALDVYARWMHRHSRSIYGCTQSEFAAPSGCRFTQNGQRLYLHIYDWPFKHLHLDGLAGRIEYAQLLNDASEIRYTEPQADAPHTHMTPLTKPGSVVLELPVRMPDVTVPVIELFLK
ncbi:MAG: alpha-L-fucosidase [Candidatus Marinimicrobia bacterium]|nr:alpha-L-fucosidase [Candidatus Neomarinimicrobiota bacterium]